jgi:hypothetical protein
MPDPGGCRRDEEEIHSLSHPEKRAKRVFRRVVFFVSGLSAAQAALFAYQNFEV